MPVSPTGFRRLTPSLLKADRTAEGFDGLPDGVTVHGQLLAAFKAAAPRLGLSPRLVHAIDWLFRFTQPQDWGRGGRPIVWPSASMQQEALGLSANAGEGDQPRADRGRADHHEGQPERQALRRARPRQADHRSLWLRSLADRHAARGIRAAGRGGAGGARRDGPATPAGDDRPQRHHPDPRDGGRIRLRRARNGRAWPATAGTSPGAQEGRAAGGDGAWAWRAWSGGSVRRASVWKTCWPRSRMAYPEAVDSDPLGPENRPHQYTYKPSSNPEAGYGNCHPKTCRSASETAGAQPQATPAAGRHGAAGEPRPGGTSRSGPSRHGAAAFDRRAGAAGAAAAALPDNPDADLAGAIVDAADWLRGELGVSKSLWGEACLAMGREEAAIAIAIVSAKPAEHFRSTPGGYFHGMVAKAKAGELNLARTIWGLRQAAASKPRREPGRAGGLRPSPPSWS